MSSVHLRATLTPAELRRVKVGAVQAGRTDQDHVAELIRAGLAAEKKPTDERRK